jgi:hypothetical protein
MRHSTEHTAGSGAAFTLSARELLLVAFVLVVPIPLLAASGLNVPLPAIVERVAGSLAIDGGGDPLPHGSIRRAHGETIDRGGAAVSVPTRSGSPFLAASWTAAATAQRRVQPQPTSAQRASGTSATGSAGVATAGSGGSGTAGAGTGPGTAPAAGGNDGGSSDGSAARSGGSSSTGSSGAVSVSVAAGSTGASVSAGASAPSPGASEPGETTVSAGVGPAGTNVDVSLPVGVSQPTLPVPGG